MTNTVILKPAAEKKGWAITIVRICAFALTIVFFIPAAPVFAQQNKPLRILLIGNSFSQNASRYLPQLAKEGGHQIVMGHAELGGCPLQRHWDSVAAYLADSSRGKAYNGKSLKQLLSEGTWDVITLQQYSLLSGDVDTYRPYAKKLYDFIRQFQPDAKVVFHQTWAYRADAKNFGRIKGTTTAKSQQEMWEQSRAAYHTVAKELGIKIIPSGDAFWEVSSNERWAFKNYRIYNYVMPIYPELPEQTNSLNVGYTWDKEQKIKFDPNHANEAGCFLAGLVWYGFLFNEDPSKLKFKPEIVPDDFAIYLRKTARETMKIK